MTPNGESLLHERPVAAMNALLGRVRGMAGLLAFLGILVFIVAALVVGDEALSGSEDAPSPTQIPTLTAAEAAVARGTVQVVHLIPLPADPSAFLLAIDPPNGIAGPGPMQTAADLPLGDHVVSLFEVPGANRAGTTVLESVACQSDRRLPVPVEQAQSVTVKLTRPGEKITCVFQSSLVSSTRSPAPTP